MTKFEIRRAALERLVRSIGRGGIKRVADKIGKEPSYVSRMLYSSDKSGAKNIGEDSCEAIELAFPGWLSGSDVVKSKKVPPSWPFELVSQDKYDLLTHAEKCRVQVHMADEVEEILKGRQSSGTKKVA
jgi:hypothetical protein